MPLLTHVGGERLKAPVNLSGFEINAAIPHGADLWKQRHLIPDYSERTTYVLASFGNSYCIARDGYDVMDEDALP